MLDHDLEAEILKKNGIGGESLPEYKLQTSNFVKKKKPKFQLGQQFGGNPFIKKRQKSPKKDISTDSINIDFSNGRIQQLDNPNVLKIDQTIFSKLFDHQI